MRTGGPAARPERESAGSPSADSGARAPQSPILSAPPLGGRPVALRARKAGQPKVAALLTSGTQARRDNALGGVAQLRWVHHFFAFTSFKTWMFSTRSATTRRKRTFYSRSVFSSFRSLSSCPVLVLSAVLGRLADVHAPANGFHVLARLQQAEDREQLLRQVFFPLGISGSPS